VKPKLLRFAGIGPFRNEETIDFEHLDAVGLYLIVGPTGAGKTTIFEAMTYALFAEVPSKRDLKSTYKHEKSFIEFIFTHGGNEHRVFRDLLRPNGDYYEQMPNGNRVAQRRAVTQQMEGLLKLTAEQFMKIVLLPQGQFQEFLVASTADKEEILQRIFGTEIYDNVAEQVGEFVKQIAIKFNEINSALEVETLAVGNDVDDLRRAYPDLGFSEDNSDFEAAKKVMALAIPEAERASSEAGKQVQKLSGDLARANDLVILFDDCQQLDVLRKQEKESRKLVSEATVSVETHARAERALRQKGEYDKTKAAVDRAVTAQSAVLRDLRRESGRVRIDLPQVATFTESLESSPNLPEEFGILSRAVSTALDQLETIAELQGELAEARELITDLNAEIKSADKSIRDGAALKTRLDRLRRAMNSQIAVLPKLQRKVDTLDAQLEKADVAQASRDVASATQRLAAARRALEAAERALSSAQRSHELHLAGQLAKHLEDGDECPVCGSIEHPKPARSTRKVDVQSTIDRHGEAKSKLSGAQRDLSDAKRAYAATKRVAAKLPSERDQAKLRQQFKEAELAARDKNKLENRYESAVDDLAEARQARTELAGNLRAAEADVTRISGELKRASKGAPPKISDAQRHETSQAITKLRDLSGKKHRADAELSKQTTRLTTLEASIKSALEKEGFRSVDSAMNSLLTEKVLALSLKTIDDAKKRDTKILELAARVKDKDVPKVRPDLTTIQTRLRELQTAHTAASTRVTKLVLLRDKISNCESRHAELRPQADALRDQYHEASALEKAMKTGQGTGLNRVYRLQEWIQRRLFEQVCRVASEQLRMLSKGRYIITLEIDADTNVKRAQGLDLYVLDSFNGTKRSVASLSGGETFLASLALALALAEVVQSHAGGIKLPCLFIDEGFGSLDRETLESATDALLKLQNSGRTIGVITHVESMHDHLRTGIQVVKTDSGSRLEFPLLR
jgi:exonuclease SbcC